VRTAAVALVSGLALVVIVTTLAHRRKIAGGAS
jgi:hypothetical protein